MTNKGMEFGRIWFDPFCDEIRGGPQGRQWYPLLDGQIQVILGDSQGPEKVISPFIWAMERKFKPPVSIHVSYDLMLLGYIVKVVKALLHLPWGALASEIIRAEFVGKVCMAVGSGLGTSLDFPLPILPFGMDPPLSTSGSPCRRPIISCWPHQCLWDLFRDSWLTPLSARGISDGLQKNSFQEKGCSR
jgi:hypothetical protein